MNNKYAIYFSYGGQVLQLPQNPETIPVDLDGDNQEYNVLGVGEITVPRTPKQKKIRISSYFPARHSTPAETYIKFFQDALYEQRIIVYTPVRYMETGESFNGGDNGFQCLVNSFSTEERGGETGDFYYTLEIVEYRDYSPKIVDIRPVQTGYAIATSPTRVSSGVQVGDTVKVSGDVYGYSSETKPIGTTSGATAVVKRKDDGILTLKPLDDVAKFNLIDDTPRKYVAVKTDSAKVYSLTGIGTTQERNDVPFTDKKYEELPGVLDTMDGKFNILEDYITSSYKDAAHRYVKRHEK